MWNKPQLALDTKLCHRKFSKPKNFSAIVSLDIWKGKSYEFMFVCTSVRSSVTNFSRNLFVIFAEIVHSNGQGFPNNVKGFPNNVKG